MTVLFAFASSKYECAFLGADDKESSQNKRADKLSLLGARFAVGIYGVDAVQNIINFLDYFANGRLGRGAVIPPELRSAGAVCDEVARLLAMTRTVEMARFQKAVDQRRMTEEALATWEAQHASMVVLDRERYELTHARSRHAFGKNVPIEFILEPLADGRAYRFGLQAKKDLGEVPDTAWDKPRPWCASLISDATRELEPHGMSHVLGKLGATFHQHGGEQKFVSAFGSVDDMLNAHELI